MLRAALQRARSSPAVLWLGVRGMCRFVGSRVSTSWPRFAAWFGGLGGVVVGVVGLAPAGWSLRRRCRLFPSPACTRTTRLIRHTFDPMRDVSGWMSGLSQRLRRDPVVASQKQAKEARTVKPGTDAEVALMKVAGTPTACRTQCTQDATKRSSSGEVAGLSKRGTWMVEQARPNTTTRRAEERGQDPAATERTRHRLGKPRGT